MTAGGTDPVTEPAREAPATVVIAQRVNAGREDEFRRWQEGMNRAVASFPGFLGTEVVPPAEEGGEWTVLYRFDSKPRLERWLASPERAEILGRGEDLFDGPASQQVLMGEREEGLVTVVVSHPVRPADEEEFLEWQGRVTDAERGFAGFRGSQLSRPVPGVQEDWTAVFSFDTEEHLNAWLESPQRKKLLDEARQFQDFELHRVSSPFGSWFSLGRDADGEAPADWKTALSVLVGLYPTVVLLTLGISEIWEDGELWETLLLGNILSVSLLTWVVMPIVTRALGFWLAPAPGRASPRLDAVGAAASIAFLTLAAVVFWLVTTQIWTLP
jgi:antibiotic biosynthesis monooxygenase (ABM) superfamily enzyme